jgi:hypothetical protein
MGTSLQPDQCPDCHAPFPVDYAGRRRATLPLVAKGILAGGIAASIVLVPAFLFLIGNLVGAITKDMNLHKKERGLIFGLAYLLAVPIALLPGWLAMRFTLNWPRNLPVKCSCGWSGICKVKMTKQAQAADS